MAYQVLARKSRPQDFESVVGQEPIVTALRNALTDEKIAQAYLFSGIRGVGKTSVARILAKALNCERGFENAPCNECETCLSIGSSSNLDILEIDAATHSKVEQVRTGVRCAQGAILSRALESSSAVGTWIMVDRITARDSPEYPPRR